MDCGVDLLESSIQAPPTSATTPITLSIDDISDETLNKRKIDDENEPPDHLGALITSDEHKKLIEVSTYQLKKRICIEKFKELNDYRMRCLNLIQEQYFLDNNYSYLNLATFLNSAKQSNDDLRIYVSNKFAAKDGIFKLDHKLSSKFELKQSLIREESVVNVETEKHQSIAERARHEAQILQRINLLRKEGLWSIKRLPKLVEPQRAKTHWDYLLDEMVWMSSDFQQERKWKKNASKKIALAIQKYFKVF